MSLCVSVVPFFLCLSSIPCVNVPQFVYPFTCERTFVLFPAFDHYRQSCREHLYISLCMAMYLHFSWTNAEEWDDWIIWQVCVCLFLRNCQTILQSERVLLHPTASARGFWCSDTLTSGWHDHLFYFSHFNGYIVVSYCDFNLRSPND